MNLQSKSYLIHVFGVATYPLSSLCCSCTVQRNGFVKASRNFNQSDLDEDISRYATHTHMTHRNLSQRTVSQATPFVEREWSSLTSQIHFRKRGKGLVNCVTNRVPPHCTVRSNHIAVFCHMTHHITVE